MKNFLSFLLSLSIVTAMFIMPVMAEGADVLNLDSEQRSVTATIVKPTVSLSPISNKLVGNTVTVSGSSSTPCYRMAAKYTINGTDHWLGDVNASSYSKSFKITQAGTYTVTLYARSYPESDPRSVNSGKSVTFTASQPTVQRMKQEKIDQEYFMAVPENGLLNHFAIKAIYTEKYTPSGNHSIFNNRSVWYEMKQMTNGTADFFYGVTPPDHVSDWRNPPNGSIFDSGYDFYGEKVSTTSITYPKATASSGTFYLRITSYPPALNPYSGKITISFNTEND